MDGKEEGLNIPTDLIYEGGLTREWIMWQSLTSFSRISHFNKWG